MDAAPSPREDVDGVAVYREVFPQVDAIYVSRPDEIEELLLLRSAGTPRMFR